MKVELNGKTAVAVVVVVLEILIFKVVTYDTTLSSEVAAVVKESILFKYRARWLARTDISDQQKADKLLELEDIPFVSIKGKGDKYERIVQLEIAPNDAHPPDLPYIHYMEITWSMGTL